MPEQNYSNHTQKVPVFGFALLTLLAGFVMAAVTAYRGWPHPIQTHHALMLGTIAFGAILGFLQCRRMATKVQDRAIRAEENLRHFAMTGKLLDKRLTTKQIIAVRFASDDQFVELARQAAEQSMTPDAIKRAVKTWRADFERA